MGGVTLLVQSFSIEGEPRPMRPPNRLARAAVLKALAVPVRRNDLGPQTKNDGSREAARTYPLRGRTHSNSIFFRSEARPRRMRALTVPRGWPS